MYQTIDLGRCAALPDDDFVAAFESLTLEPGCFGHPDHVRLAHIYLQRLGLLRTLACYGEGLRALAAHNGAPERYHETVTWALVILVHERMAGRPGAPEDWSTFAARNPDLLRWRDGVFFEYYRPEILESEVARRVFVLPR